MMPANNIVYKVQTANYNDVLAHLQKCDENFEPRLSKVTDIAAYSQKIAQNSVTFEAWTGTELVGLIAAYFNDEKKHAGFITNVSTVKEYFGKGIAAQLMKNCISYGKAQQFEIISLEVNQNNNSAIQLYKKYDFLPVGEKGELVIMKKDL